MCFSRHYGETDLGLQSCADYSARWQGLTEQRGIACEVIAVLSRHRRPECAHDRRGARRCDALRCGAPGDGVYGPRVIGIFERRESQPRRDHQNRQCPLATHSRRSSLALPPPAGGWDTFAHSSTRRAAAGDSMCLDGAASPPRAVSTARWPRQITAACRHGGRA